MNLILSVSVVVLINVISTSCSKSVHLELSNPTANQGQIYYEDVKLKSAMPTYGQCWHNALLELHTSCKHLGEGVQRKLAFTFAQCFLQSSGRKAPQCPQDTALDICLGSMDQFEFSAYQTFFVHTQSICFYLKSELWQEQTADTIAKLTSTSSRVVKQLENSNKLQQEIVQMQSDQIRSQNKLLEQGHLIGESLEDSRQKAIEAYTLFEKTTTEQKDVINRVFDTVVDLKSVLFGFFSGVDSFLFYVTAIVASILVTGIQRAYSARFWIILLWTACSVAENVLLPTELNMYQHTPRYYLRWSVAICSCFVWLYCFLGYKDYLYLNWRYTNDVSRDVQLLNQKVDSLTGRIENMCGFQRAISYLPSLPQRQIDFHETDYNSSDDETYREDVSDDDGFDSDESFMTSMDQASNSSSSVPNSVNNSISIIHQESFEVSGPRYNLRSRSVTPMRVTVKESPKSFEKVIMKLAEQRRSVSIALRGKSTLQQASQFSDDEN